MTKIINLHGGPGVGKSTSGAVLYAMLKQQGVNAELVREYVKDWAWEGRKISTYDQIYIMGKQVRRESLLYGKTDVIVTDSPVLLGVLYARKYCPPGVAEGVFLCTKTFYAQAAVEHRHVNVLLKRTKSYNPAGRYQTEAEAIDIDGETRKLLEELEMAYIECGTSTAELEQLLAA